jgi:hypothetical protein
MGSHKGIINGKLCKQNIISATLTENPYNGVGFNPKLYNIGKLEFLLFTQLTIFTKPSKLRQQA